MIRKSTFHLNFANAGKQAELRKIMEEARRVVNVFIDDLWSKEEFKSKLPSKFTHLKTETFLSAKAQQALSKQASEIVKSQRKKKVKHKPELKKLVINLDSRFVEFIHVENSFDFWIKIYGFYPTAQQLTLRVPSRKHRHFNALAKDGWKLKGSTRLGWSGDHPILDAYFEKGAPPLKTEGKTIGIDIGYRKLLVTSAGQFLGREFKILADKIARKKQDSKGFKKALKERDEYVNKAVKAMDLTDVKEIRMERLRGLKNGRRFHKQFQAKFQRWTYPALAKRVKLTSERLGVLVSEVNPAYTSQTCSLCGTQNKHNRKGEIFKCVSCGHENDADLEGAVNISRQVPITGAFGPG